MPSTPKGHCDHATIDKALRGQQPDLKKLLVTIFGWRIVGNFFNQPSISYTPVVLSAASRTRLQDAAEVTLPLFALVGFFTGSDGKAGVGASDGEFAHLFTHSYWERSSPSQL